MSFLRQRRGILLLAVLVLLALFIMRPGVNGLRKRIINSVSLALGRKVDVQWVKLQLLPQPGFDLVNFVVYDEPSFSAEPVLRAQEVTAVLRLRSLLRGRLEIGRLSLKEPSLNLVRRENGHWNLESLIERATHTEAAPTRNTRPERRPVFPYIEADNGRINFKIGLEKKAYSLTEADFALWLESDNQWSMRLAAQPVRTDFNLSDTGILRVNGSWQRSRSLSETPVKFTVGWEGAQLGEVTKLLYGKDMGWRGALLVALDLAGTPANLNVNLQSSLNDFRRYDIVAQKSLRLATSCEAVYSSRERAVSDLVCTSPIGKGLVSVKGRIAAPTGPRTYDLSLALQNVPMDAVAKLARRAKRDLPSDLSAAGEVNGTFSLQGSSSSREGLQWDGSGYTHNFVLRSVASKAELVVGTVPFGTQPAVTAAQKKLKHESQERRAVFVVGPFTVPTTKSSAATVLGWATASGYHLGIQGDGAVQRLLQLAEIGGMQAPRLTADGNAKFDITVAGEWHGFAAPRLTGTAILRSVKAQVPGVKSVVDIRSANVTLDPDAVYVRSLVASAAGANWDGSLSFPRPCHLLSGCPIRFDLHSDTLAAERLQQSLSAGSHNRAWYRLTGFGSGSPSLLSTLNANGTLAANRLVIRGVTATHVRCKVAVHDGNLHISELMANVLGGKHQGEWTGNLAVSPPEFSGEGKFEQVDLAQLAEAMHNPWISGTAAASYEFAATGKTTQDWLASSKGVLVFNMYDGLLPTIVIAAGAGPLKVRRFTGALTVRNGNFELAKGRLESTSGPYEVTGTASSGQKLQMKLTRSGGGFVIDGTLSSPRVVAVDSADTRAALKP
ncbi:MAG TPA: AsmA family protein [Terriglobales bacterium]|nr:AsmA family protein [Terriglobales bacterium]